MSAAGLIHLAGPASRAPGSPGSPGSPRVKEPLLYVGTYTEGHPQEGIYLVRMDPTTGAIRQVGSVNAGDNPSFLALHPNGRALYAVNEVAQQGGRATGGVTAFTIESSSGALTRGNAQPSEGADPCYVSVRADGRAALVANYTGGTVAMLPIQPDGSLAAATFVDQHHGKGPKPQQDAAHAHCFIPDPSGRFAIAADLGVDRVFVYRMDAAAGALHHLEAADAMLPPGSGPRHLAFHPTLPILFVASELASTLTTMHFDADSGALTILDARSTLPADWSGESYVADIHVSSSGRHVYVSNRGHNSIAMFGFGASGARVGRDDIRLLQHTSTGGDWPRNFALDPTERWLLVANQRSNNIVVYARDASTGQLTSTRQQLALPSPVCLRFAPT